MILKMINHSYSHDMTHLCTLFFPYEKIRCDGDDNIVVITEKKDNSVAVSARVYDKEKSKECVLKCKDDPCEKMSVTLYEVLSEIMGYSLSWGILFGVRPAKLMHRFTKEMGEEKAKAYFVNSFLVNPKKASLAAEVMKHENKVIALSKRNSYSLYVSIPFCPSRCSYCSFVSHSIEKTQKLIEPYVSLLCKELEKTAEIASSLGLRLETIYFGGGTPTALTAPQLKKLLDTISNHFDLKNLREYTVEAGRPDTITEEKLITLKNAGVERISINPQSFNDDVLCAIGRRHTAKQAVDAFNLARECGFDNINMDFIAGLPKDSAESFRSSIDMAVSMGAESVTVHTLALKSAAYLVTRESTFDLTDRLVTAEMVDYSNSVLSENGYYPYYMYRQSKALGNLENVGWCKEGMDCLYNVYMMDETHSVLAVGAGGVTRLKNPDTAHIERIYNYKYPYEYIDGFAEILKRKNKILNFYNKI